MHLVPRLTRFFTQLISETSGLALEDTLSLAEAAPHIDSELAACISEFHALLGRFRLGVAPIESLLEHPVSLALGEFFRAFPIPFRDEHIHLSGSLDADFVYPRLAPLLEDPTVAAKIQQIYGPDTVIRNARDIAPLIRIGENDRFDRYLKI